MAAASCGPALFPKSSMAVFMASVLLPAFLRLSCISWRAWSMVFPSFVAFFRAVFMPVTTAEVSIPFLLKLAINPAAELRLKPISCNCTLLVVRDVARSSTLTPVFCPAFVNISMRSIASPAESPQAAVALCTLSIDVETSVSLIWANFIKSAESCCRSSPVTSKRVATSPTAAAAWSNVVPARSVDVASSVTISRRS